MLRHSSKKTAPFYLNNGRDAQFLFIRRIFPEDLFLTGSLKRSFGFHRSKGFFDFLRDHQI